PRTNRRWRFLWWMKSSRDCEPTCAPAMWWPLCPTAALAGFTKSCSTCSLNRSAQGLFGVRRLVAALDRERQTRKRQEKSNERKRRQVAALQNLVPGNRGCSHSVGLLLRTHNAPVVVGLCRHRLVLLNPIDYQLAHFGTGPIDDRRLLVHRETAAALHAVVVGDDAQLLGGR